MFCFGAVLQCGVNGLSVGDDHLVLVVVIGEAGVGGGASSDS